MDSDLSVSHTGNITLSLESDITSTTGEQTIASEIYTFPSNGNNRVNAELTLKDGKVIKLNAGLKSRLEKNKVYTLELIFSENQQSHSFTLEDINVVEEEIEFN